MSRKGSIAISQVRMKGKIFSSKASTELKYFFFVLGNKNLSSTTKANNYDTCRFTGFSATLYSLTGRKEFLGVIEVALTLGLQVLSLLLGS